MTSGKIIVKLLCVFSVVAGVTFSAHAMKRLSDVELDTLYKKYTIADDFVLTTEVLTEKQQKHQERVNAYRLSYNRSERELEDMVFQGSLERELQKLQQQQDAHKKQKFIPMPGTPMPTPGNKKRKPDVPINVILKLNELNEQGNVAEMQEILKKPSNVMMLQSFRGYHNGGNLVNNDYLSTERIKQFNTSNNNNS